MQDFTIVLKSDKTNKYNTIGWLFIFLNCAAVIWVSSGKGYIGVKEFIPLIVATVLVVLYYRFPQKGLAKNSLDLSFFLVILHWISLELYLVAAIVLLISILHNVSVRTLIVRVNTSRVIYPSFPKKEIQWNELSNIMLKDGLLTIDFKNNKIIQQLIEMTEQPVNEKEFNDFCSRQLEF